MSRESSTPRYVFVASIALACLCPVAQAYFIGSQQSSESGTWPGQLSQQNTGIQIQGPMLTQQQYIDYLNSVLQNLRNMYGPTGAGGSSEQVDQTQTQIGGFPWPTPADSSDENTQATETPTPTYGDSSEEEDTVSPSPSPTPTSTDEPDSDEVDVVSPTPTTTEEPDSSEEVDVVSSTQTPTTTEDDDCSDEDDESQTVTTFDCEDNYKPVPGDIRYYLHFDGFSQWLTKKCPDGFGFDPLTCVCSIRIATPKATTTPVPTTTTTTTTTPAPTPEPTTTTTTTPEPTTTPAPTTTTSTTTLSPEIPTTVTPSLDLCTGCVVANGVGYAPFPGNCQAYIQCRFYGDVPTVVNIKRCPSGLQWNQDKLTCDYAKNVNCVAVNNCPNHKAIQGDSSGYLVYTGLGWSRVSCPSGTSYSDVICGCTDIKDLTGVSGPDARTQTKVCDLKANPGDATSFLQFNGVTWIPMPCPPTLVFNPESCTCGYAVEAPQTKLCPDLKASPGDPTGFLQFNGVSWVRMPCPASLVFKPEECGCGYGVVGPDDDDDDDSDENVDKGVCKPSLVLSFDNNDASDSSFNQFWVNNTGVTFKDGKAYFNGRSRLVVPGFSNGELGSTVYILAKYKHTVVGDPQTIISNGDCDVAQSVGICSTKDSVDFYAVTTDQLKPATINVPGKPVSNGGTWQYVMLTVDKNYLQGYYGDQHDMEPIKGSLERRQRGFNIGGGGQCDNFHGIIDEIEVYLCKPPF